MRISDWSSDVCSSDLPVDKRICTRMVIKICLRRGEGQPALLELREMATNEVVERKHIAIDSAARHIEEWMGREVRLENGGVLSGVCRKRMLVIHRSEERRVGKGGVCTGKARGS